MSGFGGGGGFGGSSGFGGGGFGSSNPPLSGTAFGAGPSSSAPTTMFGSSPNISTTGFGGSGGFGGSSTGGGFGSTTSGGGASGGFGFGSSTGTASSTSTGGAFGTSAPFHAASSSVGFGSTLGSSSSSMGGFGGFGGNSGGFGGTAVATGTTDMGFEDTMTPSFGNPTTATTATSFHNPSGFSASSGGGFGTTSTGTTSTFGTAPATSTSGGFALGGGFGTSASTTTTNTFGSAPASTGFGGTSGGGGFGTSITFGSSPSNASAAGGGFGSSSIAAAAAGGGGAFGTSTGGFGSVPATTMGGYGASTSFGNASTTSTTGGFGTSTGGGFGTSTNTFGSAPASSSSLGGFGGTSTSGGFGASSSGFGTSTGGFGAGGTASGGFGSSVTFGTSSSTNPSSSMSGFGTNTGGMFSTAPAPSSDFGSSSSGFGTNSTMAFGASANVVTTSSSNQPQLRFGQSNSSGWHPKPSANPFAPSTSQDDGMMGEETSHKPDYSNPQSTFPTSNSMTFGGRPTNRTTFQATTTSPIPEENEMGEGDGDEEDSVAAAKHRADEEARLKAKIEEKKRLLQAKIEEKKKKLMEKQRQKREQSITPTSDTDAQDSLVPSNINSDQAPSERNAARLGPHEKSLAERNAIRFGEQDRSSTREILPPAMRAKAERATPPPPPVFPSESDNTQQRSTERQDLKTAKALVGTCLHFCPEEELLRREREGDIQQLEIPLPGKLHPAHWTLQHTAVKRFRRSAADYKLDVPEWVRPPDVLEQVCGYLEEWVMERDRQGPDPRFPQGQTPPPLEVYQFIWDRTRMIRKDFTLQNYVGTGGKCDARAVRCHERIARWHAMCEHQLSHIPEFVTMQSQQNIQELGQTMKTLNQFYDDSMNRATVEVPDEHGKETRLDLTGFSHGCTTNCVQGQTPMEFDGSDLNNGEQNPQVAKRILGKHAVNHPAHGTAEPEMRGLYMLLTMNNEGGMEVLKYAARLFQERPEIYASKPVQLALEIFKAKKDYNYARFFSILRAPTTPYLFCCIMFKHVELMRKIAFRIMSKTFGARKKDTGEAIYDAYPLSRLIELLCFEDAEEARTACTHYNITVKQVQMSASREEVADIIFWRASEFKEPIHPEKGYVLPLQPRKMTRIIEQKLHGATRLAVCRGEVSGEGATIRSVTSSMQLPTVSRSHDNILPVPINPPADKTTSEDEQAKAAIQLERQKLEASKRQQEALLREQERVRLEREQKKKEEERLQHEAKEKQAKELEKQRLLKELELQKQEAKKLEEERKKEALEKEAIAERMREETKRRELEAESKRRREEEKARQKAEEERRAAEETRRREEEARIEKERLQRKAEEQRRQQEAERQALLRRELERKREREAEEKRKAEEWEEKVNAARRLLLWKRWQNRINRSIVMTKGSAASLEQLDPTFSSQTLKLGSWFQNAKMESSEPGSDEAFQSEPKDIRRAIDASVRDKSPRIPLSSLVVREMAASQQLTTSTENFDAKTTLLLKVALLIPPLEVDDSHSFLDLLKGWIHSRIGLNEISTEILQSDVASMRFEARSMVRHCRNAEDSSDCDVALILVPPSWSTSSEWHRRLSSTRSLVDDSIPRLALVLSEFDDEEHETMKSVLAETLGTANCALPIVCTRSATPVALEKALETSCKKLAKIFVNKSCIKVDRISVPKLVARAVSTGLWSSSVSSQPVVDSNVVLETARNAISAFIKSANAQLVENEGIWSLWPSSEFVTENGVDSYFSNDAHLPRDWISSLSRQNLEQELGWMMHRLSGSFRDVVESFLIDAPTEIREECGMLVSKGYYRRGLQSAMHWFAVHSQSGKSMNSYIYFPRGLMEEIFDELELPDQGYGNKNPAPALLLPQDNVLLDTLEEIDQTIKKATEFDADSYDLSILASGNNNKRRHHDTTSTERDSPGIGSPSRMSDLVETKKFRSSSKHRLKSTVDMEESAAFSQRLQDLMKGATVELEVGDSYLSNILRNAPPISNRL